MSLLPFQRILCPTDFSEPSFEALRVASELAQHFAAELLLLHTVTPIPILPSPLTPTSFNVKGYHEEIKAAGLRALEEAAAARVPAGVRQRHLVTAGDAAQEVVRVAEEQRADLIVIASHGRTGWRRFVNGSVTEKVVRLASRCAVLTIRARPPVMDD